MGDLITSQSWLGDLISSQDWLGDRNLFSGLVGRLNLFSWLGCKGLHTILRIRLGDLSLFWDLVGGFINIYRVVWESYVLLRVGLKEVMSSQGLLRDLISSQGWVETLETV